MFPDRHLHSLLERLRRSVSPRPLRPARPQITSSSPRRRIRALNRVLGQAQLSKAAPETVQAAPPQHPVQKGAAGLQCEQTQGALPGRMFASALRVPV